MLEGLTFDHVVVLNDNFIEYKIPTSLDAPHAVPKPVEVASPSGLYGMKGVGEPAMVAIPAATANAIYDAIGIRIRHLPITPEKLLQALRKY